MNFEIEPDVKPTTKEEILDYSYQYQKEWRFEREKRLIEYALTLFPHWKYLHDRLEWHSRPVFHPDPEKSKTQPRKPLNFTRDPRYIPKQETIDSMCFVTASGSDQPYFDLSIQLLESIKATNVYKDIPIKILDCGLTPEDADYLRQRFNAEVKDPGWDVDPALVKPHAKVGWKGVTARSYLHKHFPGYQYYFWIDTDTWVQNEKIIDRFVCMCEQQGVAAMVDRTIPILVTWHDRKLVRIHPFTRLLHPNYRTPEVLNRDILFNGFFCLSFDAMQLCEKCDQEHLALRRVYGFGTDMMIFTYVVYHYFPNAIVVDEDFMPGMRGSNITDQKAFENVDIVVQNSWLKNVPYYCMFANRSVEENMRVVKLSEDEFRPLPSDVVEEKMHFYEKTYGWKRGTYYWRLYLDPEGLYGDKESIER